MRIADDRAAFLAALETSLRDDTPLAARARQAVVAGDTWDKRVEAIIARVAGELARAIIRDAFIIQ